MKCPKCGTDWDGGSIFDTIREQEWSKDVTDEQLNEYVRSSYSPPYRWDERIQIGYKKYCRVCNFITDTRET